MFEITAEKGFLADGVFRRAFPAASCQWLEAEQVWLCVRATNAPDHSGGSAPVSHRTSLITTE